MSIYRRSRSLSESRVAREVVELIEAGAQVDDAMAILDEVERLNPRMEPAALERARQSLAERRAGGE